MRPGQHASRLGSALMLLLTAIVGGQAAEPRHSQAALPAPPRGTIVHTSPETTPLPRLDSPRAELGDEAAPAPDLDTLLERLARAEAEIDRLKQGRTGGPPDFFEQEPGDRALEADTIASTRTTPEPDAETRLQSLQKQFDEFKANLNQPKFPTVEVHGVFQVDTAWFHQTENSRATVGDIQDGSSFRRARLSANGKVLPNFGYFIQMDFAFPGRPTFTDVWMELNEVPVLGNVRVGQWKQPFSLEVVSSFRYTTFAERSLLFQTFAPFRHIALGFYDWSEDECWTWAASVYRSGNDQYGGSISDNGNWSGVGRVTHLAKWEHDGRNYVHTGLAYNYTAPRDRLARFRTIPEYFVGEQAGAAPAGSSGQTIPGALFGVPFFVDTDVIPVNHYSLIGTELLWVEGPFSLQSEFQYNWATLRSGDSAQFPGYYAQVGYFLTGEHRPYLRRLGQIDRVKVLDPIGFAEGEKDCTWGWGAWELAARHSYIDLNSDPVRGGRLQDLTLGVNWYVNSYAKVQFNYIRAFLDNPARGSSQTDIFGVRGQVDF